MENKILTVSILGVGARGGEAYGRYIYKCSNKFKITALCDVSSERLEKYGKAFDVCEENRFLKEDEFFAKKRSDVILIATMDQDHVRMAERALDLGYDVLLEKPITNEPSELVSLVKKTEQTGKVVMVCHVLRYTVMMTKIKEVLDSGEIGRLIAIEDTENVGFWHQAHSFVRGNWRNTKETSPMIMQKCCHDLDLLQYFASSRCESVSSMGSLAFFKKENQPEGASDRCHGCKLIDSCVYSAKKIYIEEWNSRGRPENAWPMNVITDAYPLTEEAMWTAIKNGPYGRCVFACDNDVVDNQTVVMTFENGITATLKMEAFTKKGGRDMRFYGTKGELILDEQGDTITLSRFFGEDQVWKISELTDDLEGHGGGDHRMIDKLYEVLTKGNDNVDTAIANSVESHYMALASEESRLLGGTPIKIAKYRKI